VGGEPVHKRDTSIKYIDRSVDTRSTSNVPSGDHCNNMNHELLPYTSAHLPPDTWSKLHRDSLAAVNTEKDGSVLTQAAQVSVLRQTRSPWHV
jgi:hypothetical protein